MATTNKTTEEKKVAAKATTVKADTKASMKDLYDGGKAVTSTKTESNDAKSEKNINSRAFRILIKPLVTEKATVLGIQNKYAFAVEKAANKIEIAKAINAVYGIKPTSVNVVRMDGKKSRYGKAMGKRKDWKKAIVTLPKGKAIQVYEGV